MLDEQMDDIIREAASQHHPPYNDKAWYKMEVKLNAMLPLEKNNRKALWFILLFLLVGGGAFYAGIYYNKSKNIVSVQLEPKAIIASDNTAPVSKNGGSSSINNISEENIVDVGKTKKRTLITENTNDITGNKLSNSVKNSTIGKTRVRIGQSVASDDEPSQTTAVATKPVKENDQQESYSVRKPVPPGIENGQQKPIENKQQIQIIDPEEVKETKQSTQIVEAIHSKLEKRIIPEAKKSINKPGSLSKLGIAFSLGPDISFVSGNAAGKTTLVYGAGIQYNFSKRITLSAGFYVARKLYAADSASYKMPAGFYPNNYRVKSINGNCKVYEIPLNVYYSFGNSKKHHWFAGTGFSSYLMKNETYNYDYKYGNFPGTWNKEYEVYNENKHWLSVLTLTAGYSYNTGKRLSFTAAPYFKIPLAGVGFGKVKLNSTGLLFTAIAKPF